MRGGREDWLLCRCAMAGLKQEEFRASALVEFEGVDRRRPLKEREGRVVGYSLDSSPEEMRSRS